MGLYEVGVYLVIIVVASVCVFGIMWLLMRSMTPKRPKRRKRVALATAGTAGATKQLPQQSGETKKEKKDKKNKKEKKEKKGKGAKVQEEKLLKLKEMPDSRLLSQGTADASSKDKAGEGSEKPTGEIQDKSPVAAGGEGAEASAQEAPVSAEGQDDAPLDLPDLPSLDTLTTEEEAPKEEEIDLMSVFETEDAEDSATSDLAANLFDVDVQNIEKLSSEVSEFLNGMRSR